jgi:hypothetical protein
VDVCWDTTLSLRKLTILELLRGCNPVGNARNSVILQVPLPRQNQFPNRRQRENCRDRSTFFNCSRADLDFYTRCNDISMLTIGQCFLSLSSILAKFTTAVKLAATISDFEQSVMGISNKVENRGNSLKEGELFNAALARWNEKSDNFERDSFVAGLVLSLETRRAMGDLSKALRDATTDILGQQKNTVYQAHHRNIVMKLEIAIYPP